MSTTASTSSSAVAPTTGRKMIWLYSACIILDLIPYGIGTNLIGPSLVDFQFVYDTSVEAMSYLASFFALGYMLGALVGWLMPWLNRQLTIAAFLTLQGAMLAIMPHCGKVGWLYLAAVLYSVGGGAYDSTSTVWLVDMWPKRSEPFLQTAQFAYGLGMIVGPMIAAPFIYGDLRLESNETMTTTMATTGNLSTIITGEHRRQMLTLPFGLASLAQLTVPLVLVISYLLRPYIERKPPTGNGIGDNKEIEITGTRLRSGTLTSIVSGPGEDEVIPYRTVKLILATISLGAYGAFESSFWSFYAAVLQYLPMALSANQAASVLSLAGITYSGGRLVAIFASMRVSPDALLSAHNTATLVSLVVLYLGHNNYNVIIYATAVLGFSFSPIWPALFSFTERHLRLTDGICSAFSFLSGTMTLIVPLFLGGTLQTNPIVLFYALGVCAAVSAGSFVVLKIMVTLAPRRQRNLKFST